MKKYKTGNQIKSLDECLKKDLIMFQNKVYHRGWFLGWQTGWLSAQIVLGNIFEATPIKQKILLEDFIEKHPAAELSSFTGCPRCCPSVIGYRDIGCEKTGMLCKDCWSQPVKTLDK